MELFESHFSNLRGNLYEDDDGSYSLFSGKGRSLHINYLTFKALFENMKSPKNLVILESGIASRGTQSTYLFNELVRKYGGQFWSVDTDANLVETHRGNMCPATQLVCDDSVAFFKRWITDGYKSTADVIYLDSYDLNFYDPEPSGKHGLAEYNALIPAINKDTLLLIDDTPASPEWLDTRGQLYADMVDFHRNTGIMPGKGMYVLDRVNNAEKIIHNYQLLYRFLEKPV
jgi:hypothetical protein